MKIFRHSNDSKKIITNKFGHYFICLKKNIDLPNPENVKIIFTEILDFKVIYTGIRKDVRSRFTAHFEKMDASRSTFQLSLGSLFGYKTYLDSKNRYNFKTKDAAKLKEWIYKNCLFIYLKSGRDIYSKVEEDENTFISIYNPPLNLAKTSHIIDNKLFRSYLSRIRNIR
tara:strand:+ start:476 stop:985 length:510 start_codon:yes stop_codon:yes gene_type:complete